MFAGFRKRTYVFWFQTLIYACPKATPKLFNEEHPHDLHCVMSFKISVSLRIIVLLFSFNGILVRNGVASRAFVSSFVLTLHPIGFRKWLYLTFHFNSKGRNVEESAFFSLAHKHTYSFDVYVRQITLYKKTSIVLIFKFLLNSRALAVCLNGLLVRYCMANNKCAQINQRKCCKLWRKPLLWIRFFVKRKKNNHRIEWKNKSPNRRHLHTIDKRLRVCASIVEETAMLVHALRIIWRIVFWECKSG